MKYDFAESLLQRESTECKGDSKEKRINRPQKIKCSCFTLSYLKINDEFLAQFIGVFVAESKYYLRLPNCMIT